MKGKIILKIEFNPEIFCKCYHITEDEYGCLLTNGIPITPEWLKAVILENHSKISILDDQVNEAMTQLHECTERRCRNGNRKEL